jgi:hypothetical protein
MPLQDVKDMDGYDLCVSICRFDRVFELETLFADLHEILC